MANRRETKQTLLVFDMLETRLHASSAMGGHHDVKLFKEAQATPQLSYYRETKSSSG